MLFHAAPDPSRLPDPLAATAGQQLANLATLMEIEALRAVKVRAALARGLMVVLDRTVDTLLAHAHAIGRRAGFDCDEPARALVLAGSAVIPDVTLLLQADHAVLERRAARRMSMPPIFYEPRFTSHFLEHFDRPVTPCCIALPPADEAADLLDAAMSALAAVGAAPLRGAAA